MFLPALGGSIINTVSRPFDNLVTGMGQAGGIAGPEYSSSGYILGFSLDLDLLRKILDKLKINRDTETESGPQSFSLF